MNTSVLLRLTLLCASVGVCVNALTLEAYLEDKAEKLLAARESLQQEYQRIVNSGEGSTCDSPDACQFTGGYTTPDFGQSRVDLSTFGVFQQTDGLSSSDTFIKDNLICATSTLSGQWIQNYDDDSDIRWQYFGAQDYNLVSIYPYNDFCPAAYDARFRPWYAQAASQPKDVVVILDTSGSMSRANRLSKAKEAAKSVLNTLSFADFFQLITFNDDASLCGPGSWTNTSPSCADRQLIRATDENKARVSDFIDTLQAGGQTNMGAAMNLAFDILDETLEIPDATSNCYRVALFMTDGEMSDGTDNPVDVADERNNSDIDLRIFTYSFGDDADTKVPKKLACENKGIWNDVSDSEDLAPVMSSYYVYFALGVPAAEQTVKWTQPYDDAFGLGRLVTANLAAYDTSVSPSKFFGVVAMDVPLSEIYDAGVTQGGQVVTSEGPVYALALELSSVQCGNLELSSEDLEELRGSGKCSVNVGVAAGVPAAIGGVIIIIVIIVLVICCMQSGGDEYGGSGGDLR